MSASAARIASARVAMGGSAGDIVQPLSPSRLRGFSGLLSLVPAQRLHKQGRRLLLRRTEVSLGKATQRLNGLRRQRHEHRAHVLRMHSGIRRFRLPVGQKGDVNRTAASSGYRCGKRLRRVGYLRRRRVRVRALIGGSWAAASSL